MWSYYLELCKYIWEETAVEELKLGPVKGVETKEWEQGGGSAESLLKQ